MLYLYYCDNSNDIDHTYHYIDILQKENSKDKIISIV
jgi:hypothetical protein